MKRFFLPALLCISFVFVSAALKKPKKKKSRDFVLSGFIQEKHDYCGGAAPSYDQVNPKPAGTKGIRLYIRKNGSAKIIDSVLSGESGAFSIRLPEGEYCFVEGWKTGALKIPADSRDTQWDSVCFRKEYERCDFSIHLDSDKKDIAIILQRHCPWSAPCSSYSGPMPPSAPPPRDGPKHQE